MHFEQPNTTAADCFRSGSLLLRAGASSFLFVLRNNSMYQEKTIFVVLKPPGTVTF